MTSIIKLPYSTGIQSVQDVPPFSRLLVPFKRQFHVPSADVNSNFKGPANRISVCQYMG